MTTLADEATLQESRERSPRHAMSRAGELRSRIVSTPSWVWHLLIAAFALVLRTVRLGTPDSLVFDESYYVKQAWSMILTGVELRVDPSLDKTANDLFASGSPGVFTANGDLVVHPPLGKWLIAAGQSAFGVENPWAWRIVPVIAGALTVYVLARLVTRLLGPWWGTLAAALLTFESTSFVVSRTGILDIFVGLFGMLALWFVVIDRDWTRARLLRTNASQLLYGPWMFHPWRWAAGASLGAMTATKWSGLYLTAVLGLFVVAMDMLDRRKAGVVRWHVGAIPGAVLAFVQLVILNVALYVVSWAGWFASDLGYARNWARENPASGLGALVPDPLRSLWQYHKEIFDLSLGMESEHPYATNPITWMLQDRPTLFFQRQTPAGTNDCTASSSCYETVSSIGTVPLWWLGILAFFVCVALVVAGHRMGRVSLAAAVGVVGIAGLYLPWFTLGERTIYSFYTGAFAPVVILCVVTMLAAIAGRDATSKRYEAMRWAGVGLLAVTAFWFVWFYPVLTGQMVSQELWESRMGLWKNWT